MTGAIFAHPVTTRLILYFSTNTLKYRLNVLPVVCQQRTMLYNNTTQLFYVFVQVGSYSGVYLLGPITQDITALPILLIRTLMLCSIAQSRHNTCRYHCKVEKLMLCGNCTSHTLPLYDNFENLKICYQIIKFFHGHAVI